MRKRICCVMIARLLFQKVKNYTSRKLWDRICIQMKESEVRARILQL